jgi:demethylmenaquinone methyltransferase/2-methoxy-6-polyprenyl-1,4-benzoquinol methylase
MSKSKALYRKQDPASIQALFGSIAKRYDRTNSLLSFNLHKRWNQKLVDALIAHKSESLSLLDLCCGTGEIAYGFLEHLDKLPSQVFLLDFCKEMLECAKAKESKKSPCHKLTFLEADAEKIPLADALVDRVSVAYGIRNVANMDNCFREAYRVLKPHGLFAILELTRPKNPLLQFFHNVYLRYGLPAIGYLATSERSAYEYLCSSVTRFVEPEVVAHSLSTAHFVDIKITPLTGGIATLITAKKP